MYLSETGFRCTKNLKTRILLLHLNSFHNFFASIKIQQKLNSFSKK